MLNINIDTFVHFTAILILIPSFLLLYHLISNSALSWHLLGRLLHRMLVLLSKSELLLVKHESVIFVSGRKVTAAEEDSLDY